MRTLFEDKEHLIRMVLLFVAVLAVFLVLRGVLLPEGFGVYGHFRAGALDDNRALPLAFAGAKACVECHEDVVSARAGGRHAAVNCEACHGALASHAEDPDALKPGLPEPQTLCLICHQVNVAKPASFPQVDPADHGDGEACNACHQPHNPGV